MLALLFVAHCCFGAFLLGCRPCPQCPWNAVCAGPARRAGQSTCQLGSWPLFALLVRTRGPWAGCQLVGGCLRTEWRRAPWTHCRSTARLQMASAIRDGASPALLWGRFAYHLALDTRPLFLLCGTSLVRPAAVRWAGLPPGRGTAHYQALHASDEPPLTSVGDPTSFLRWLFPLKAERAPNSTQLPRPAGRGHRTCHPIRSDMVRPAPPPHLPHRDWGSYPPPPVHQSWHSTGAQG